MNNRRIIPVEHDVVDHKSTDDLTFIRAIVGEPVSITNMLREHLNGIKLLPPKGSARRRHAIHPPISTTHPSPRLPIVSPLPRDMGVGSAD